MNNAESPTPTPTQKRGDPTYEEGGGIDTDGTPTEDESLLVVEEETDANRSATRIRWLGRRLTAEARILGGDLILELAKRRLPHN